MIINSQNNQTNDLRALVMGNKDSRTALREAEIRHYFAELFEEERLAQNIKIRALAEAAGTSVSQVQRMLGKTAGGSVTLLSLVRMADALDVRLSFAGTRRRELRDSCVVRLSQRSQHKWHTADLESDAAPMNTFCDGKTHKPGTLGRIRPAFAK